MVGFILLNASQVIDNPWAAFVAMIVALAGTIVSSILKVKGYKSVFYVLSAICVIFGGYITFSQNNMAKIDAEKEMKINKELTDLRVENDISKKSLEQTALLKDKCLASDSLKQIEIFRLSERNKDLERDKKSLKQQIKMLNSTTTNWRGTKAYNGVVAAQGKNGKWGYVDKRGNIIYGYVLKRACRIYFDRGGIQNTEGKWGFIDSNGFVQVDFKYDDARHFEETKNGYVARVLENEVWYFINKYGKKIKKLTSAEMASL